MIKTLRKVVRAINEADDIERILGLVVHKVRLAINADICSVYLKNRTNQRLVFCATEGLNQSKVNPFSLESQEGFVGWIANCGELLNTFIKKSNLEHHVKLSQDSFK